ncbi:MULTISPECIES: C40 family peptidase [Enterococcus]|uniref:hypothetical protein n=2 Tax=Enterococcus TaxID=1350 RepID=UPI000CF01BAA|nr:hypothetical protein [Enterococcus mundtii]MBO1086803.1 hypothetical protein [Enterococcus mundtii]MDV7744120.1 hypothetical protein [Enterococcus mundtii]PQC29050.1 hypothetical protein CUM97_12185 [Enterococcus mundtii]
MKLKLFFTTFLLIVSLQFSNMQVHAEADSYQSLEDYYEFFKNEYASFEQTFEEFSAGYYNQTPYLDEDHLKEYAHSVNDTYLTEEAERLAKIPPLWSFNIGNSLDNITFEKKPEYGTYDLLNTVQPGDLIFEVNRADILDLGVIVLHHIMIVDDIVEETHIINGKEETFTYIRTIEATKGNFGAKSDGVVYGVLDDERFDYTNASILRVPEATVLQKQAAILFMKSQLGKSYSLSLSLGHRDRTFSRQSWYCSMLVWAAYMNATPDGNIDDLTPGDDPNFQGIDLESKDDPIEAPSITPNDIWRSDKLEKISPSFPEYNDYTKNITWAGGGSPMEGEDFIFSRNSNLYYLENDYHFLAIDQNNQRPYTNKSLTLGRNASGNVVAQLDLFTNFALTDEAKQKYADKNIPVVPNGIELADIPNYVMNWINRYTQCSFDIVYSKDITTDSNHLRYNPTYSKIDQKAHPSYGYLVSQVVHTPPAFTQRKFDYTENLSVYENYDLAYPNPLNYDVSYTKNRPTWYYFFNNFHALIKLENGTYRSATYLRFHGSFTTPASQRNGYGLNHDFTMTDEAKTIYQNYYYHIGVNQSVDYAIDWLNQYTKEEVLIVYSTNITNDLKRLNDGTATVGKGLNNQGKLVNCII